jgi:hypothetical protein
MYFKSIISGIFISLAIVSFSANAALVTGVEMELTTTAGSPLELVVTSSSPSSQTGQMTGSYLGLDWVLDYTALLNYELRNNLGVYSSGVYNSFLITSGASSNSTTTGVFFDTDLATDVFSVSSTGVATGKFGDPISWVGTGKFTFLDGAKQIDVPAPATIFLSIPALIGLLALRRRAKSSVA